ncbi:MAG: ABC transporter substrate-binding protein [Amphritea sp.]
MRSLFTLFSSLILSLVICGQIQAAETEDAKAYITRITTALESALQEGRENNQLQDEKYLDAIIDQYIIPHVDKEYMSKRIFSSRWDEIVSNSKTDQAYDAVFSSLRRTYRLALSAYNGQPIDIGRSKNKSKYSVVRIVIHTGDSDHVIDFALRPIEDSWRVFDLSVDGVVVTKTLNNAIKRTLEAGDIDAVIAAINPKTEP